MLFWEYRGNQPVVTQGFQKSIIHTGLPQPVFCPLHCAMDGEPALLSGVANLGLCMYPETITGHVSEDLCFSPTLILVPNVHPQLYARDSPIHPTVLGILGTSTRVPNCTRLSSVCLSCIIRTPLSVPVECQEPAKASAISRDSGICLSCI